MPAQALGRRDLPSGRKPTSWRRQDSGSLAHYAKHAKPCPQLFLKCHQGRLIPVRSSPADSMLLARARPSWIMLYQIEMIPPKLMAMPIATTTNPRMDSH